MIQIGDRVKVIGGICPELIGMEGVVVGESQTYKGELSVALDSFDARSEGYRRKEVAALPSHLKKIDDDFWSEDPGIPEGILEGFKCDETLPNKEKA